MTLPIMAIEIPLMLPFQMLETLLALGIKARTGDCLPAASWDEESEPGFAIFISQVALELVSWEEIL